MSGSFCMFGLAVGSVIPDESTFNLKHIFFDDKGFDLAFHGDFDDEEF